MATLTTEDRQLRFERGDLSDDQLLDLYEDLLRPRMIEEKMLSLLRQGKISKWFSGIGQEAIAVGVTKALRDDEYVLPMHRNLGVFTTRGMPFPKLFAQWQGKATGYSKGRERSFHFGSSEHKVVGMISHLGPQLGIADGIALAHKLRKESRCTAVFTGDGATSEGDFHESLNVAAVWDLPVLFIIENNGYGLSTPNREQFRMDSFVDKAVGYGIEGVQLAGNNILEVYREVARLADSLRERPRPILVECMTFRMRGHEEASGTKYVPQELFEEWGRKDPVANYEQWLLAEGVLSTEERDDLRADIKREIEEGLKQAFAEPEPLPDAERELADVYATGGAGGPVPLVLGPAPTGAPEKRFIDAISEGLAQSMERHPELVLMGQDIAEYGGAFKITEGFVERFGKERVRNTPLCESAILGAALGLSVQGMKAMMEIGQSSLIVSSGVIRAMNAPVTSNVPPFGTNGVRPEDVPVMRTRTTTRSSGKRPSSNSISRSGNTSSAEAACRVDTSGGTMSPFWRWTRAPGSSTRFRASIRSREPSAMSMNVRMNSWPRARSADRCPSFMSPSRRSRLIDASNLPERASGRDRETLISDVS